MIRLIEFLKKQPTFEARIEKKAEAGKVMKKQSIMDKLGEKERSG